MVKPLIYAAIVAAFVAQTAQVPVANTASKKGLTLTASR